MSNETSLDFARPKGDRRLAHTTFPRAALAFIKQSCRTACQASRQPWAVIARKENKCFRGQFLFPQRFEHLAHTPVQLLDDITVATASTRTLEFLRGE